MPGPNLLTPKDIAYRFDQTGATAAVTDDGRREQGRRGGSGAANPPVRREPRPMAGCRSRSAAGRSGTGRPRRPDCIATTRCSSTSRAAPSLTRRWSSTRSRMRSATSGQRASGRTCVPVTCTGPSPTPAGRRLRGVGCSGRCTNARRSSTSRSGDPTPTRSSRFSPAIASRRSAPRQRSTGGWSRATSPSTTSRRCGIARAPASR